jgi:hypothetical protein
MKAGSDSGELRVNVRQIPNKAGISNIKHNKRTKYQQTALF